MPITRDEVRQKLRVMLYQEQKTLARVAKDCGMDAKTIQLAANGEMTNRTLQRFDSYFYQLSQGRQRIVLKENYSDLVQGAPKDKLIEKIGRLFKEKREIKGTHGISREKMEQMDMVDLAKLYLELENYLKFMLMRKHEAIIKKAKIYLYDKWDYQQWKEKIDHSYKDLKKLGISPPP
jgi:hypothetical protein